jgi:hypothetical protein
MFSKRITLNAMLLAILFVALAETAQAKSLYVINDTYTSQLRAYKITGTSLIYQTDYICRSAPGGSSQIYDGGWDFACKLCSELL